MAKASNCMLILSIIILFFTLFHISSSTPAADSITPDHPLLDGDNLSSTTGFFELGFFSPPGSTSRYVGIWYKNIPVQTVVWVANREAPLINDSSGVLSLTADGNLALHRGAGGASLWSTNTSSLTDPILHLLDSGNLILSDGSNTTQWQSFDYPSNNLLPGMEIGRDPSTNLDRRVTSWKSASDPSPGEYSLGISVHAAPDIYIWNGSAPMSRYGPWDGGSWGGYDDLHGSRGNVIHNYISRGSGGFLSYDMVNKSVISTIVMDPLGVVRRLVWENQQWITFWVSQGTDSDCARYARCGGNGLCDSQYTQVCKCLPGFEPRSVNIWNPFASTKGCFRRAALAGCRAVGDGFRNVTAVRVPELLSATNDDGIKSFDECRERCLSDCNCTAFTFFRGSSGCIWWSGDLVDVEQLPEGTGQEFYLRLAASELPSSQPAATDTTGSRRHAHIILIVVLPIGLFVLGILLYFLLIRRYKRRGMSQVSRERLKFKPGTDISITLGENEDREMKFLLFDSSAILNATDNFSEENKLGEGGFGPVYKGLLQDGQEIAVKRLSTCSGQGLEEFENEILLIAKLQHRNLVRLLGCCIQKEEMLIYEYMPNKSLDFYIFDSSRRAQLNWHMRFHIIEGIAQGLSYLHKYSRLRIIHRDLKASNILLDGDMNPKISDFGIARIFGSNAILEKTRRVVGTYGYMAPEYALEGLFSIKSDVFSFGVVLLEIISGKRNNYIYQEGNSQNLLGYAWTLWKGIRWFDLVDLSLDDTSDMSEIYKCIHVALMCVQESFEDRPTMSEVITMLSSENASLPEPKQPAFFNLRFKTREGLLENVSESFSLNEVTITTIDGR